MRYLRIGSSGMHGLIGSALNAESALRYATAFSLWIGKEHPKIAVGTDTRWSSPMLKSACLSALLGVGADVVDCGICPAPLLHHAVSLWQLDGALLIGAGHHPAGWNAILPISSSSAVLTPSETQEFLDLYHSGNFSFAPWNAVGKIEHMDIKTLSESYLDRLERFLNVSKIADANFRIICDFCNGSGAFLADSFASRFHLDLIPLNNINSGVLPHDPEPRPRSSMQTAALMPHLAADAGFVFNSDASRLAVITNSAETLSEEYTLPLVTERMMQKGSPHASIVTNCCTTRTLDEIVSLHHGVLYKGKVGQTYAIDKMSAVSAILAGDGSGSVAIAGGVPAFDGFAALGVILEAMAEEQVTLQKMADRLPRFHIIKTSVPCPSAHAYSVLRSLRDRFDGGSLSELDGLRYDWDDGWVHLRFATTEPIIRLIVEWRTREQAEEKVRRVRSMIERIVAES